MSEFPCRYVVSGTVDALEHTVEKGMSSRYEKLFFNIQFFSDEKLKTEVKPSIGEIVVLLSPDGSNFYEMMVAKTIDIVTMYQHAYMLPSAEGPVIAASIKFSNVDAAAKYFKANFVRY